MSNELESDRAMVMNLESFGVDGVGYDETETRAVRQLSGLRVPFSMLLFCLVSTSLSAPCPLKDHVALASFSFINGMSVPSCVVAPVRAWCIYAVVFVLYVIMYFMFGAPIF